MELFQKKIGPIFLKENSDSENFIEKMRQLESQAKTQELQKEIKKQINFAEYGAYGEKNIAFELRNSGIDMYILHDICIEYKDLKAQIDYLIVTRKKIFIIECKNLIGNIEIDSKGNFIRTYEMFGKRVKEGIYSPVTQNQRHLNVLKECRKEAKGNFILKAAFEHYFEDNYKSLIVLANPKTYFNYKFAPKELRDKVIRADQLVETIKKVNEQSKDKSYSEKEMRDIAQFYLDANRPDRSDYADKYEKMVQKIEVQMDTSNKSEKSIDKDNNKSELFDKKVSNADKSTSTDKLCPKCGANLVIRKVKKGDNVGKSFYGCSNFPKCRYTENI